ncbi:DUF1365 domain-containing protein [Natronospira bacteriovora]|uniref:DUF1365 domain-containing protein n=1 Tax=Natronospira bacteriovora TaxID=3069753 RepID=A0ABU0W868_9GAMM|nr:DUF1365 domain-containing protein [Natronospira sp. AB-CW4]MDQ2070218.1 DUF1365 domain-containing protein [Natronospira sp. AB-CW4]
MRSATYDCQVMHRRQTPRFYRFRYRVFSLLLDIDELDELAGRLRLFSRNRFNLVSFHDRDFGPRDGSDLRQWAEGLLRQSGLVPDGGSMRILCFPRVLGYGFNPLSAWYCHRRDGELMAVILEVRNTFGEKHHYLIPVSDGQVNWPRAWWADKAFHVSPFIGPDARYCFRLREPDEQLLVRVEEFFGGVPPVDGGQPHMLATWSGRRRELSDRTLLRLALRLPPLGIRIITLIHWHALKLWLRGVPFHRKPAPPTKEATVTCPQNDPSH